MNQPIRTILVDDESKSRVVLRTLLNRVYPQIEILAEASDAEEAFELINELNPQLVFLDIQMPRADGFSLLKRFNPVPFEVIFVTSFDQYAISAIKFSALDYILKPVEVDELSKAVYKAIEHISLQRGNQTQIINLLRSIDDLPETHHVAIHTNDSVRLIEETSIISITGDGHYCMIRTDGKETFTTAKNLRDFEDYFGDSSSFIRIGKSQMINAKKILKYSKGEPFIIEMINGEMFEVARRRKPEVLAKIKRY
jgi:two-component system, LytTR family, response regulator